MQSEEAGAGRSQGSYRYFSSAPCSLPSTPRPWTCSVGSHVPVSITLIHVDTRVVAHDTGAPFQQLVLTRHSPHPVAPVLAGVQMGLPRLRRESSAECPHGYWVTQLLRKCYSLFWLLMPLISACLSSGCGDHRKEISQGFQLRLECLQMKLCAV